MQLKPSTMHPRPLSSMGSTTTQVNTDPPATLAPRIINDTTEKDSLIASWRESKLSKAAFCREYNLSTNQFYHWTRPIPKRQRNKQASSTPQNKLLPATVATTAAPTTNATTSTKTSATHDTTTPPAQLVVEVQINNNITIKLPLPSQTDCIVKLIKDLSCN